MGSTTEAGTGLIGHWKLDDRAGTRAIDSSGSGNNGTLTNFALAGATSNWVSGRLAGGLHFDGVNDYVQVSIASLTGAAPTAETWSMWVKPSSIGAQVLLENAPTLGASQSRRYIKENADGTLTMVPCDVAYSANTTSALAVGQWTHVVVVSNGSNHKIYMNGKQEVSSTIVATCALSTVTTFGYGFNTYFNGYMDDIRVYNRALNADQIRNLYTSGSSRPTTANTNSSTLTAGTNLASGLVGHWTFDGHYLSTTTARDTSGSGNNGAITAAVPIMGVMGQAMSFNGSTAKVVAPSIDLNGEMTLSAWFKTNNASTYAALIANNTGSGTDYDYGLFLNYTLPGKLTFLWESSPYIRVTSTATIIVNTWYHVVAVRSGSTGNWTAKMYINGALDNTATGITVNPNAVDQVTTIGAPSNWVGSFFFNGSLDDVRIYNRALSATEVKQLYNLGK
jgi:hypothetical protein